MSDTTLRNLLPKNLRRMTDSHMQLCGCEICIISKNLVPVLNKWCTVTYNSMMKEAHKPENVANKEQLVQEAKTFRSWSHNADGSPKRSHPRDFVDLITCPKVDVGEGRKLSKLRCCLGRCSNCPELYFPSLMRDQSPDAKMMAFEAGIRKARILH